MWEARRGTKGGGDPERVRDVQENGDPGAGVLDGGAAGTGQQEIERGGEGDTKSLDGQQIWRVRARLGMVLRIRSGLWIVMEQAIARTREKVARRGSLRQQGTMCGWRLKSLDAWLVGQKAEHCFRSGIISVESPGILDSAGVVRVRFTF